MYQNLLNGLFANHNLTTQLDKEKYLQSLQPHVRSLRTSYNSFPVRFDYTNVHIQAGYLLAYFPHYTDLLLRTLNTTGNTFANSNINELLLFGSGPCPEIIGYLRYIQEHTPSIRRDIKATIYDIAATDWKWSRDIVYSNVAPSFLNGSTVKRTAGQTDISKPFSIEIDSTKKLCVFQNCLNEISVSNHQALITNIKDIFQQLSTGSYLAIIDLNFRQVLDLITQIETSLKSNFKCEMIRNINDGEIAHRTSQRNEPSIITDHLLIDKFGGTPTGLLTRRNINFIYALIKKC